MLKNAFDNQQYKVVHGSAPLRQITPAIVRSEKTAAAGFIKDSKFFESFEIFNELVENLPNNLVVIIEPIE